MRITALSNTVLLIQAAALSLALPHLLPNSAFSSLNTRGQAVNTGISDALPEAPPTQPQPNLAHAIGSRRGPPRMVWYAPNSRVHVILTPITVIAGGGVEELLNNAANLVMDTIEISGDGLIPHGYFDFTGEDNLWLTVNNASNHQTTWSVLARALAAVLDFMRYHQWGSTTFLIYDGGNQVGEGQIG